MVIKSMKKSVFFVAVAILFFSFAGARVEITGDAIFEDSDVGVSSVLLKIAVTEGESLEKPIYVFSDETGEFFLEVINLEGVSLSEQSFSLDEGGTKEISVKFDSSNLEPGIYVGKIEIINGHRTNDLPISFEVESEDLFFDANLEIPPAYSVISSGGKFVAQIKIFDLTGFQQAGSLGATSVDVDYFISSIDGNIISWETEQLVVDEQSEISKTISFSEDVKDGDYFFGVIVRYGSSVATASQMFSIEEETEDEIFPIKTDFKFLLILVFILIVFAGFVFMFVYLVRDRDKLVLELREYNAVELRAQRDLLMAQQKVLEKKGESKEEIRTEIKKKIGSLKKKQRERVGEFRKLKKVGSVSEMKRKLSGWKGAGYNTKSLEYKMKGLSAKEMQKILSKWKGQGYKK